MFSNAYSNICKSIYIFHVILIRFVMLNHLKIGKLLVVQHGDTVGKGQYGKVFRGQYDDAVDVSVLRVDRKEIKIDTKIWRQTDMHPNIVRFYGAEDDGLEFQ